MRKNPLVVGETYHVFCRSIANFKVFNNDFDFVRMQQLIKYYRILNKIKFSKFIELQLVKEEGFDNAFNIISNGEDESVQIIAYCLMPNHIHLILKQLMINGISKYMKDLLISYTRTFNLMHKRMGPLWESRFKSVLVDTDEQLLHLTRYQHLNPVTANLVSNPEDWVYSSYREYLGKANLLSSICKFEDNLEIIPNQYQQFVCDRIAYQKELAIIKKMKID